MKYSAAVVSCAVGLTAVLFLTSLLPTGQREVTPLENIRGIPYPRANNAQIITEELAHADIYLTEPVLAKNLKLDLAFQPGNVKKLAVGIRENSFWLSYNPVVIYDAAMQTKPNHPLRQQITIPLTDKLQETDRSLDLMFFAEGAEKIKWELHELTATSAQAYPTWSQLKEYMNSIRYRERAL